ncbi:MAG: Flp pilus assembly complex ATPase component TadA [Proteobacteria bacterium]|nr:Flp pilus assembly complex ATPase component TadA [Pseudomonadota bacterium]
MKRLGDVLLDEGIINPQQLELCLQEQKRTGELLGNVLIRLGMVTRKDLARAMAYSADLPFVDLKQTHIDPNAINLVPHEVAKKYKLIPFAMHDNTIRVAMDNPTDVVAIDVLRRRTRRTIEIWASDLESIMELIEIYYEVGTSIEDEIDKNVAAALSGGIAEGEVAPPVVRMVELILIKAIRDGATDVHITPEESITRVSYRIDGIVRRGFLLPKQVHIPLVTRIKVMGTMNIAEQRLPQEGNISFEFSGRVIDIRSSTSPTDDGENVVLRILDKANIVLGLDHLGFGELTKTAIRRLAKKPHGILLAAGPTGSGKTTTLYSMLREINALERNILTIEDPIEYRLPLIKQTQVNEQAGLTFSRAIRHFLRQDPDILLVGEIRDLETAKIAFQAAMTGHLVLSTIHTNDATSTIARLLDLGVEPYLIPTSLRAVVAQRLLRRLCQECAEEYVPGAEELEEYGLQDWSGAGRSIKRAKGCSECDNTGYRGRTGVFEIFEVTPHMSRLISEKASADVLFVEAVQEGMVSMQQDGLLKVLEGQTALEEVFRVTA